MRPTVLSMAELAAKFAPRNCGYVFRKAELLEDGVDEFSVGVGLPGPD